jgi:peptidoglycan pentaglycine glycine transferase (the first glycine)
MNDIQFELSSVLEDQEWDRCLENAPSGQYEQTSFWARAKAYEGWRPVRILFRKDSKILAGCQILKKSVLLLGSIGYIMKGPVVFDADRIGVDYIISTIVAIIKKYHISAVIVQAPDNDRLISERLPKRSFLKNYLHEVTNATLMLDLSKDVDVLFAEMKRQKRQNISHGARSGITITQGTERELSAFFSFLTETCRRQNTKPNPYSEQYLRHIWNVLHPLGRMKLFIAGLESEKISGILAICFGQGVWLWKFGWAGKYGKLRPNELLFWEVIQWAKKEGYRSLDFVGIDINVANKLSESEPAEDLLRTPTFFKLGFGGKVRVLQGDKIYIANPILRSIYKAKYPQSC